MASKIRLYDFLRNSEKQGLALIGCLVECDYIYRVSRVENGTVYVMYGPSLDVEGSFVGHMFVERVSQDKTKPRKIQTGFPNLIIHCERKTLR